MSQQQNIDAVQTEEALEPPPNYALGVFAFIIKTLLIAVGVFGLAWILVNVKFN